MQEMQVPSLGGEDPLEKERAFSSIHTAPVSLPGKSHGQRSLVGYSPRGCKESDMTETTEYSIHIVDICQSQSYHLSLRPFPLGNHKFVFYICDLISVL